jgi:hypothetical protein
VSGSTIEGVTVMTERCGVFFERGSDRIWTARLISEPRVQAFGRSLAEARSRIRDAAAAWYQVSAHDLEFDDSISMPDPDLRRLVAETFQARQNVHYANLRLADAMPATVNALLGAGYSMRETAEIMQMSHQRVQQVAKEAKQAPRK